MTVNKLQQATEEISVYREDIINRLLKYAATDVLLFWGTDEKLIRRQEREWAPLLEWARDEFDAKLIKTHGLDVPEENMTSGYGFKNFLEHLSDRELAAYYLAALNMRSVLLAAALVKGRINAEQAFQAACLEELFQAEEWGRDEEAESKRRERLAELQEIEKFLK